MRTKLSFLLISLILMNCSSSKVENNYRTYTNEDFTLNFPKNWEEHDDHGFLAFCPKVYLRNDHNYFQNMLTIYKLDYEKYKIKTIDSLIDSEKDRAIKSTIQTRFTLGKDSTINGEVVVLKMNKTKNESLGNWSNTTLKHYYQHKGIIYELSYDVITNEYSDYINDAMMIFNSFKFND